MVLHPIVSPLSEFAHVEKGDALYGECSVFITQDAIIHLDPSSYVLIFLISFLDLIQPWNLLCHWRSW